MSKTKTRTFTLQKDFIGTFFQHIEDTSLNYELTEVDEDGDLRVEVEYSPDERNDIMSLVELEDEFYEKDENEEEEEEKD